MALFVGGQVKAQVSGIKTLPGDYASFNAFVNDINTNGIGPGGVTLNIAAGYTETAPAGGFVITATGTANGPIIIQKSGSGANPTFTAPNPQPSGSLNDGIIKIHGGDFITIRELTLLENAANTITAATTNNMTEWGIALLYATTTNGCQNITIDGCTITLNRTYPNTWGIYANSTHSPTAVGTVASATGATGGNNNLTIIRNNISNVNNGICIVGPTAAADYNNSLTIGGSAANANTITDFGTTGTFSSYANVSGTVNGILVRNTVNYSITHNTITSSVGGVTSGTLRGVFIPAFNAAPVGTHTNAINNNNISLRSGAAAGSIEGIIVEATTSTATSSLSISNNDFNNFGHTVAGTAAITFIRNAMATLSQNINNNTFTNINVNTTGNVTFISNDVTLSATGTQNVNNNSIVGSFTKTGAGGTVLIFTTNATSVAGAVVNNNNNNFSNITVTGATTLTGWSNTDGGTVNKTISNNTFTNWIGGGGTITVMTINFGGSSGSGNVVSGNIIDNISGQGTVVGISVGASATISTIVQNTISNLNSTGAAVNAISSLTPTSNILRNKIYNISSSNTLGTVNGITVTGGTTVNIQNNVIGNLTAPASTSTNAIRGIDITSTGTCNVFHNTVYLNATSTSTTTFGTSCVSFSSSPTSVSLRNNVLVNLSTPAQAAANNADNGQTAVIRRSTAGTSGVVPSNYATTSNRNILWVNSSAGTNNHLLYVEGTGTGTVNRMNTITQLRTFMVNRDQLSDVENVAFVSTNGADATFLQPPATATRVESRGDVIAGLVDAYNGLGIRTGYPQAGQTNGGGFSPDAGAYEGDFGFIDLFPPTITYTPLGNTSSLANRPFNGVVITDPSGVNTTAGTRPRVYYKRSTDANTFVDNTNATNGWKFVEASNAASPFNFTLDYSLLFGPVNTGTIIQYFVVAQDLAGTPNVGINSGTFATAPTSVNLTAANFPIGGTINQYFVSVAYSGTINVGTSQTFTSLTNPGGLFEAINNGVVSGDITALITSNLTAETGAVALNQFTEEPAGSNFTITIKPAPNTTPTISGSSATAIIRLIGADRVTIDGSNTVNGTTRDMTIVNNSSSTSSFVIWNGSASATNGANNNTFKNLVVRGNAPNTTFGCIFSGSGVTAGGAAEAPNNNLVIQNNNTVRAQYGIAIAGNAALNTGNIVTQNNVGSSIAADRIGFIGMFFSNNNGLQVTNNTISDIITTTLNPIGINVAANVINSTFNANEIRSIHFTGTSGYGGKGIVVNTGNPNSNLTFSNNVISDIRGDGWTGINSSDIILGMRIVGTTGGVRLYHNSINLGSGSFAGNGSGTTSAVLHIGSSVTNLDIRNNVFATNLVNTNATSAKTYAIASEAPNTAFTNINFNNYFVSGSQGVLGLIGGVDRLNLGSIQTSFGQNANSVSTNPNFTSATNLLPTSCTVDNLGTFVGVTTDITGATRSATTPDIGAYEFTSVVDITPATSSLPNATFNTAYSVSLSFTPAVPGTWSISSGSLPPGLTLNPTTGVISGTPTVGNATFNFTVQFSGTPPACGTTRSYSLFVVGFTNPKIDVKQGTTQLTNFGTFNLGTVNLGSSSSTTFTTQNLGIATLLFNGSPNKITIGGANASEFSVDDTGLPTPPAGLALLQTANFTVTLTPTSLGTKTATIAIISNDAYGENPFVITLTANVVAPLISLSVNANPLPSGGTLNVGTANVGQTGTSFPITITNTGNVPLNFTNNPPIQISGPNASEFEINQGLLPASIAPGGSANFIVRLAPTSIGPKTAQLSIASNVTVPPANNPYIVNLTGTGVFIVNMPTTGTQTFTTCAGFFFDSGGATGNYQNNENGVVTFVPTSGNRIQVTFNSFNLESGYDFLDVYNGNSISAPLIGSFTGTSIPAVITSTACNGALTFRFRSDFSVVASGWDATISCVASLPPTPEIDLFNGTVAVPSGGTVTLPNAQVAGGSSNVTLTIRNTGCSVLNLGTMTLTGTHAAEYSLNPTTLPATLAPGGSTNLQITFTPTAIGTRTAQLSIVNSDSDENPYIVNLTGTAVQATQTITFAPITPRRKFDPNFTLNATASSGLPVTYTSSNPSVATVNATTGEVTIIDIGTTDITASQAGNSLFAPATSVTRQLVVNKALQNVTLTISPNATVAMAQPNPTRTVSASVTQNGPGTGNSFSYTSSNLAVATISGTTITAVGVGTSTITATILGNADYEDGSATAVLTVEKGNQIVTLPAIANRKLGDPNFTVTATTNLTPAANYPITYSSSNPSVATINATTGLITIVGIGTTQITASQAGDANFNPGSDTKPFTVEPPNAPGAPLNLRVRPQPVLRALLEWNSPGGVITGYEIERSTDRNSGFVRIATVAGNVTSFNDGGFPERRVYFYRVRAVNQGGEGAYSNVVALDLVTAQELVSTSTEVNIYPNPTENDLIIDLATLKGKLRFTITDINGKTVDSFEANIQQSYYELNVRNLAAGVYMLQINDGKQVVVRKFVKN
ncbi:MAG: choice-of-anchor D domain-containing protein [Microscillaceae bacterium]|nr:choice-of-anchor D domain-containing protein [Microscillaceae bacterium]MDW8460565.1 choice-of-anchor D domain-containing protein [Cytophagales bacterium]